MREIKVRFWDEVNKKFWFGGQEGESDGAETFQTWFDNGVLKGFMYEEVSYGFSPIDDVKHRDLITSQWTGLKDKNFKEIYEKDIVKYKDCNKEHISKVIQDFRLGTGHYIKSPGIGFYSINERTIKDLEIEVIGNVFEDSHLLEEQHG